ncbi:MAG: DUF835 domain-containing protein [Thermoplasmata archaeon]|nr:DUF835 domain-containing protein [Thermoplasmata archaeon]
MVVLEAAPSQPLLQGREAERTELERLLTRGRDGAGATVVLTGPGGIGKTRLLRWMEEKARATGYQVLWGHCLQDVFTPFFVFDEMLRHLAPVDERSGGAAPRDPLPSVLLLEEEKPNRVWSHLTGATLGDAACLVVSRDRPAKLRQRVPGLPESTELLWLTRAEGPESLSPAELDRVGERLEQHLRAHPGGVVAFAGVEYLVSQNGFLPVLRLLQFLRDVAEVTDGHLILSVHPGALEPRELSQLEAEAETVVVPAEPTGSLAAGAANLESPAATLLRYLATLEQAAGRQPLLLLVDDLQWADPQSLLAVDFLGRNSQERRIVIAGTLRDDDLVDAESDQGRRVRDTLDSLDRAGALRRLAVPGLAPAESEGLVEDLLRSHGLTAKGAAKALAPLTERAGGNPFFLLESIRQLVEEGRLQREGDRIELTLPEWLAEDASVSAQAGWSVPGSLRRLLLHRLGRLSRPERELLALAAVDGAEFDVEPIAGASRRSPGEVESDLRSLAERRRLLTEPDEIGRWSFPHPFVHEVVLSEISRGELQQHALALAEWHAQFRSDEVERLARLYHDAGETARAVPWLRRAADRAIKRQDGAAVERYVRWTLESLGGSASHREDRLREMIRLADALMLKGAFSEATRVAEQVLQANPPETVRWEGERILVEVLTESDRPRARLRLAELVAEVERAGAGAAPELRGAIQGTLANLRMLDGEGASAQVAAQKALQLLGESGSPQFRAQAWDALGYGHLRLGQLDDAEVAFHRGLAVAAEGELAALSAYFLDGLAHVADDRGDLPAALRLSEEAVATSRRAGDVPNTVIHLTNLSSLRRRLQDRDGAREAVSEARSLARKFHVPRAAAAVANNEGDLFLDEGRWAEAEAAYRAAQAAHEEAGTEAIRPRVQLARVRGEQGDAKGGLAELARIADGCRPEDRLEETVLYQEVLARLAELAKTNPRPS